jgi:hypothetical protein
MPADGRWGFNLVFKWLSENKEAKTYKNKTFKKGETMTKSKLQTEELREETEKDKRIMV